jgi:hypothetical protein
MSDPLEDDFVLPAQRPQVPAQPREPLIVEFEEYCRLLLSRRAIDRVERGVPSGFRALRDALTGQTWLIREDSLLTTT